jgi:cytochrome c oxidase subunit 3
MAASPDVPDPANRISEVVPYRPVGDPAAPTNAALSALGMWLFLAALFMLFAAMLAGYLIIRISGTHSPELHTIHFPRLLYLSTIAVLSVSATMHLAVREIRAAHYRKFREWLLAALVCSLGFVLVQVPAMILLLNAHYAAEQHGFYLYGLIFFLILTHALHVVGGLAALAWTFYWGYAGYYNEDRYLPVRNTALYWHFLDVIWVCMFLMFLATG